MIRKNGETPLFDGQGSERTVTNSSQTVTGTLMLDGFGNQVTSTGSSSDPYMYAATSGYRNDRDAGLMHVGARYYDAQVGRFTSRDTFLDQKPYLYCEHDPINYTDPSGHSLTPDPSGGTGNVTTHPHYIPGVGWVIVSIDDNGNESWGPPRYIDHPPGTAGGVTTPGPIIALPGGRIGVPIGGTSGPVIVGGYVKNPGNILKGEPPSEIGGFIQFPLGRK